MEPNRPTELKRLISSYMEGTATPEEEERLRQLRDEDEEVEALMESLEDPVQLFHPIFLMEITEEPVPIAEPIRIPFKEAVFGAAAVLLLFLGIEYLFRPAASVAPAVGGKQLTKEPITTDTILPGRNTALLTLADGSQLLLDSLDNGRVGRGGGNLHLDKERGLLSYAQTGGRQGSIGHHRLTTPKAGQYHLVLSDGTKVWLNNASTLRYPATFTGHLRPVELSGEAYFEVAENPSAPFQIVVKDVTVKVLGTSLSIMAYPGDDTVRTTLVDGKVVVEAEGKQTTLRPDEQSTISDGNRKIERVDVARVISWKDGFFNFKNADLPTVLLTLERWYGVQVEFDGPVPARLYNGKIDRNIPLNDLLQGLSEKNLHFKRMGNKLIVSSRTIF